MLKRINLSVMLLCVSTAVARGESNTTIYRAEMSGAVDSGVRQSLEDLLNYYKDLHTHPELSLKEERTAAKVAARLEAAGYEVTRNVGGYGVVGVLKNGAGPTLLIRGDMDALPITEETGVPYESKVRSTTEDGRDVGVMHACGHDVHQTVLVGTASLLAETRDRWGGTLVIIAQPAEEIGRGAAMMIADGLFDRFPRPDACLALHVSSELPAGHVAYAPGYALANVDSVDITIYGQGGHGSRPHQAIDPVVAAAHTIVALQTIVARRVNPIDPGVITVGSVHSGSKHNIISDTATMQITVRSYDDATRKILLDGIRDVTTHTCRAMGCRREPEVVVREEEFTPSTYNDPGLTASAARVFERVLGTDHVHEAPPVMGGEDFGRYGKALDVPSLIFWLGAVEENRFAASRAPDGQPLPSLHSAFFAPDPEPTISTGVRCMTSLALSLLDAR